MTLTLTLTRMRILLLACCVLAACKKPNAPGAGSCRFSDPPPDCVRAPKPGTIPGIGGHQGLFLEGEGVERLHFVGHGGAFPPPPGTTLEAKEVCGSALRPVITVRECKPLPEIPAGRGIFTCQVDVRNSDGICRFKPISAFLDPDPTHHRGVTVVRGFWDATGAWHDDPHAVTLACDATNNPPDATKNPPVDQQFADVDGAITKCARTFRLDPAQLSDAFQACVRMVRADYCGDGVPHTLLGTDVRVATPQDPMTLAECKEQCFEASWSKDGAVCVARPRWLGPGMGLDACQGQFVNAGAMACRGDPGQAVVFSRSDQNVCGKFDPAPCKDVDPVCVGH